MQYSCGLICQIILCTVLNSFTVNVNLLFNLKLHFVFEEKEQRHSIYVRSFEKVCCPSVLHKTIIVCQRFGHLCNYLNKAILRTEVIKS